VGHLLSRWFKKIYIPASYTYDTLFPWGTHPLLDPLWSTEGLEFVHFGCGASRAEKVTLVAESDTALRHLRVCYENPDSAYNCGVCEKCVRTKLSLYAVGALEKCATLDHDLRPATIQGVGHLEHKQRIYMEENLAALSDLPETEPLRRAMAKRMKRSEWKEILRSSLERDWPWAFRILKRMRGEPVQPENRRHP
jgi:hypothetical protein